MTVIRTHFTLTGEFVSTNIAIDSDGQLRIEQGCRDDGENHDIILLDDKPGTVDALIKCLTGIRDQLDRAAKDTE